MSAHDYYSGRAVLASKSEDDHETVDAYSYADRILQAVERGDERGANDVVDEIRLLPKADCIAIAKVLTGGYGNRSKPEALRDIEENISARLLRTSIDRDNGGVTPW